MIAIRHINTSIQADGECAYTFLLAYVGDKSARAKLANQEIKILFVNKEIKAGYRAVSLKGLIQSHSSFQSIETVSASCSIDRILIERNLASTNDNPSEPIGITVVHKKFVGLPIQIERENR